MRKNIKLISILAPIVTAGAIAPIATACVLNNTKKDDDKKSPTIRTLNMSNTTSLNDLMDSATIPFCVWNADVYTKNDLCINLPYDASSTLVLQYQEGEFSGSSINWTGDWETIQSTASSQSHNFEISHTKPIRFRAYHTNPNDVGKFSTKDKPIKFQFQGAGDIKIGGSLLSLVCTNTTETGAWEADLTLKSEYVFNQLLLESYALTETGINFLPFVGLTKGCYESLFEHCDNMLSTPALPATTLAEDCYSAMFKNCFDMQMAPHLPATHLAKGCYQSMFSGCTDLRSISLSYVGNFIDDSNDEDGNHYFNNWVSGTSSVGKIYYNGLDTEKAASAIPSNFTIVQNSDLITNNTVDIQFNDDSKLPNGTQTAILTSANKNKNKVRVYKTDTIGDTKLCMPPVARKTASESPLSFMDKNGTKLDETKSITTLTENNIFLRYAQPEYVVNPKVCNIINRETGDKKVTVSLSSTCCASGCSLQYKLEDGTSGTWNTWTKGTKITLDPGKGVQIRGNLANTGTGNSQHTEIGIVGAAELTGTIMSLLTTSATSYEPATELKDYAFYKLFYGSTFTKVSKDFLCAPYTTTPTLMDAKPYCYAYTFLYCGEFEEGPTLIPFNKNSSAIYACQNMFQGCLSLKKAPKLEVNKLASFECQNMFIDEPKNNYNRMTLQDASAIKIGSSDTKATLSQQCCANMFQGCKQLTIPPDLTNIQNSQTSRSQCFVQMFNNCTSLNVNKTATGGTLFFNGIQTTSSGYETYYMMPGNVTPVSGEKWYYHLS